MLLPAAHIRPIRLVGLATDGVSNGARVHHPQPVDRTCVRRWLRVLGVGGTRSEREESLARTAYVAAARRFVAALGAVVATGVPLGPRGSSRELPAWTRPDVDVMLELQAALTELIDTRRSYDRGRRRR
ncbi:hypothetical protein Adu01nite_47850 [Paractinoplanes durhamensis]|uniref:Uncharacterized protein n=1 Tax=Paractinoplanes durhamensis TaxID=113563 RepID=A0ABQ3Z0S3_9ACTN|nr:hypothetical protein Adu01nite_47850 [Actinoplanes durhamensis]